ncbi:MAG: tetratricopeptide repeat protein [Polyangiaceae bacterium]|nr:tetratricopeptide repeat protein [Polyangiaceae bacterium]
MDSNIVRSLLGTLQVDPDSAEAWQKLEDAAGRVEGDLSRTELLRLMDAARLRHSERGEWDAVAALLRLQTQVAVGLPQEADLVMALARVQSEQLFDDGLATAAFQRFLELSPGDKTASTAIEDARSKGVRWAELVQGYLSEAEQAPDDVYASSMFMRAAEMEFRFAGDAADLGAAAERLERAVRLDAANERAGHLLERIYRKQKKWDEVARVLERMADRGPTEQSRASSGIRLARLYAKWLEDTERAAQAYERVLRSDPINAEAMEFLSGFYSAESRWDDLVRLYENELKQKEANSPDRLGDCLQIAIIHWRKRENLEDAELWFDRVLKLEPAHAGALEFYRAYSAAKGDEGKLLEILQNAQRGIPDANKRAELSQEIAELAEGQENAQKAIEQYRNILRSRPDDEPARTALKRLYRQTQGYNALVELLRQELERTPADNAAARLAILREVASVYREHLRSDTALVPILNQIVHLDEKLDQNDVVEVRELVQLYEKLSRWRDLLTTQLLLADITPDVEEKKMLLRAAARRWLDQFSNVQQATDAYAALLKLDPSDPEARERLEELYRKRRAWPELFELYAGEVEGATGERRLSLQQEMARLAAERLQKPAEAIKLYTTILAADPTRLSILDALERIAEKARDFESLAGAVERRVLLTTDTAEKLVQLQKLGGVYSEHLKDEERALSAWQRVLELAPGQARALRVLRDSYLNRGDYAGLEALYESQNDWEGLAEVLSNAGDRAKDDAAKIDLSYRAARVYAEKLGQADRAFRSYERILSVNPKDQRAIMALIPLYEEDEKWARLPALYEGLIALSSSVSEQLALYRKLIEVSQKKLSDKQATVEYSKRAYELAPDDPSLLEGFEAACRAVGNFQPYVQSLELQLAALPEEEAAPEGQKKRSKKKKKVEVDDDQETVKLVPSPRRGLEMRLAQIYAQELGRPEEAVRVYKQLTVRQPNDIAVGFAFEHLLRKEQRWEDLRWLLETRIDNAHSDEKRVTLLLGWAELEENTLADVPQAIAKFRRVLELAPTNPVALARLPGLLLKEGDAAGAASVMEAGLAQLSGDDRAGALITLARLYDAPLNQPGLALERSREALTSSVWRAQAISVLEALLLKDSVRVQVAQVLAEQYREVGQGQDEVRVLLLLEAEAKEPRAKLQFLERIADVYQTNLSSAGRALDVVLRGIRQFPEELNLWDRAEELARLASRPTDLAEVFREVLSSELPPALVAELCGRAARLYEDRLGDPIGATPYLERVLEQNPGDEAAFQRLKDILTAAERWSELESFYGRASEGTLDPIRRVEMQVEVALICEEILENPERAIHYYERILATEPSHPAATDALLRLYEKLDRKRPLAELLEKRLEVALGDHILSIKNKLARLKLDLLEPEQAIGYVEDVLSADPQDYVARELAERMLEIGGLRARAARQLEAAYEGRHEMRLLDKVLGIRLEDLRKREETAADRDELVAERRELLLRVAELRDEKLHDDPGALRCLAELVPLSPLDEVSRDRLLEVGQRLGAHAEVARVLIEAARAAVPLSVRGEILLQAARLFEDVLNDEAKAAETYREVLALDEADGELVLRAARALEPIYTRVSDFMRLADIYRLIIKHEVDGAVRVAYLGKLGQLLAAELKDPRGSILAWKARLEEEPEDSEALIALDSLFLGLEEWASLVEVLERRRQLADNSAEGKGLLGRIAAIYRDHLRSVPEAIESYRRLNEQFGASVEVLTALEALFEQAARWEDLSEALEQHLGLVETNDERLSLLGRLGAVKHQHLHDAEGAIETYRRALAIDATHAPSQRALAFFLTSEDPATRREAAQTLQPIYAAAGNHEEHLRAVEIQLETSDDPFVKLEKLHQALAIAEGPLSDPSRALAFVKAAVRLATGSSELEVWLAHLDRLTTMLSLHADHVALLSEIAPDVLDGDVQLSVYFKVAAVARLELKDNALAQEYYEKVLTDRPDDRRALSELETLFEELGRTDKLLEVMDRRIDAADGEAEQKRFLYRKAQLLAGPQKDARGAIVAYQRILEIAFEAEALVALEKLLEGLEEWGDLIELYQRQIDAGGNSRSELRVKLARVLSEHQGDFARAFDELETALEESPQPAAAVLELERMLAHGKEAAERARAGEILEPIYLKRAAYDDVMRALTARLDYASDAEERRSLLTRLAKLYEEQKEDYSAALETIARLLPDSLDDESVIAELERLTKVAGAEARLAEIYATELERHGSDDASTSKLSRRTGELFAAQGKPARALEFYRRALDFEPDSRELFARVDSLLEKTGQVAERVALYRAALEYRYDTAERVSALHTIARLQEGPLADPGAAILTFCEALNEDERDPVALSALATLYRSASRFEDLAALYERQAEAQDGKGEAQYRLLLAEIYGDELKDFTQAIDQLEAVIALEPTNEAALALLEKHRALPEQKLRIVEILRPLYEAKDDWRRLIKLNEDRFQLSEDRLDQVSILRETAELWHKRGRDLEKARRALEEAVALDPEDGSLRADYESLVAEAGAWEALTVFYESLLEQSPNMADSRELLLTLAKTHDQKRDDARAALDAYSRLHRADPGDSEPLARMEELAVLLGDWPRLVEVLLAKAELALSDEERAGALRYVGEVRRDMLSDRTGASRAYEDALDIDPGHAFTLDCLIELYETASNRVRLVELYEQRVQVTDDDDELRYQLLRSAAAAYEKDLAENGRAVDTLERALLVKPNDPEALSEVQRLYEVEQRYGDLLESLKGQAESTTDPSKRRSLNQRIAKLLAVELGNFDEALDAYAGVLREDPTDTAAQLAVAEIATNNDLHRQRAAEILLPVLRSQGQHAQLVSMLELCLAVASEPSERVQLLREIAQVEEVSLRQPERARAALLRALAEEPALVELHTEIERLCSTKADFGAYAERLEERAQVTFDPDIARDLLSRLGRIAEEHLADDRRATLAYGRAIEQAGDQPDLLAALDRLYTRQGRSQELADILERRALVEMDSMLQAELYCRLGKLQIEAFSAFDRGLSALGSALERAPEHAGTIAVLESLTSNREFFEAVSELLEPVYRNLGQTSHLAGLYEKRLGFAQQPEERAQMRRSLARVLEEDCGDPKGGQRVLQDGFRDAPGDELLIEEVARLAGITGDWASALEALQSAIVATPTLPSTRTSELYELLASWSEQHLNDARGAEALLQKALQEEPTREDVLRSLERLQRVPGRERDLVVTLERRSKFAVGDAEEQLLKEAAELATNLGDSALVERLLRELLAADSENTWGLAELTRVVISAGNFREGLELLVKRSELGADGESVQDLRREAARLAHRQLQDNTRAIELYEQLFEQDPDDSETAATLRELYSAGQAHQKLADLLERLAEQAESPSARSSLRLDLAKLQAGPLKAPSQAVELLQAILEDEPGQPEAVVFLSELLEQAGRDEELADLLRIQIEFARERNETEKELRFQLRLAEICETRLSDRARAISVYEDIVARDSKHVSAFQALLRLSRAEGNSGQSASFLERLLELTEGEEKLKLAEELASTRLSMGDEPGAARALEVALSLNPKNAELSVKLGALYEKNAEFGKLAALYSARAEQASTADEQVALLRKAATVESQHCQDPAAAARLLRQASDRKPEDRELLLELCDAYSAAGQSDQAILALEKVVESYGGKRAKELGEVHRRLANAYRTAGNMARTLEELDKAFRIEPGNVSVLKELGMVALEASDLKRAQQMFRALLLQKFDAQSPITKAEVFLYLGDIHEKLGEKDKALQMFERAVQTDATLGEAQKRLDALRAG